MCLDQSTSVPQINWYSQFFPYSILRTTKRPYLLKHKGKISFFVMCMCEFDGTAFVNNEAVLEVFFTKNCTKTSIASIHDTLT